MTGTATMPCPMCDATGEGLRGECHACHGDGEVPKFVKIVEGEYLP